MKEQAFKFGENKQGIGTLTLPDDTSAAPIVILLNAGLSHRAEPYRLNVLVARALAEIGYICVRVDLSGKGDTPARVNMTNRESVELDWQYIKANLLQQFGERSLIIFGLCSGADNGIKIAAFDPMVKGLILLDAVSKPDKGFYSRELLNKLSNPNKWKKIHKIISNRVFNKLRKNEKLLNDPTGLRDEPTDEDMQKCFNNLVKYNGRILMFFTGQALYHYNERGQFCKGMNISGLESIIEEVFWPQVEHIYSVQTHRDSLLKAINIWGLKTKQHLESLREN